MSSPQRTCADGAQYEFLDLVSCTCPSCRLVTWHPRQSDREVFCPFCHQGLPAYVTKVSAERIVLSDETRPSPNNDGAVSPFVLEFFMVQGIGFQCMAYRNGDGKWHEAFNNRELLGVVHVLE